MVAFLVESRLAEAKRPKWREMNIPTQGKGPGAGVGVDDTQSGLWSHTAKKTSREGERGDYDT